MTDSPLYELRRRNLTRLLEQRGPGVKQKLALALDMTPPQVSHWLRVPSKATARRIKENSARAIEAALGLEPGALDRNPEAPPDWTARDSLMLDAMARVARAVEKTGIQATRSDMLELSRAVYELQQQTGTPPADAVVEAMVKLAR